LKLGTPVRYRAADDPQQLDHLASRHAVLVSTVLYLPHPKDGYVAWRRKWGQVTDLVDEIIRVVRIAD
jgi:hypothetical protein